MPTNRRDFLKASALSAPSLPLIAAILSGELSPEVIAQAVQPPQRGADAQEPFDESVYRFWTSEARERSDAYASGVKPRGPGGADPEFVYFDDRDGFLRPTDLDDKTLPEKGKVNVTFRVERFRPSASSREKFNNLQSGSLRVDLKQTEPLPSLREVLAWTAVAAVVPDTANKLPALQNLTFDPGKSWGQLQEVPLTNGLGFWGWNFFLKKKEGTWGEIMRLFRKANEVVFPLLGLPAIAVTALTAVDRVFGYLQAKGNSEWLFKSVDSPVYATQEGKSKIGQGLALKTGHYVIIPSPQLKAFGDARKNLTMKDGYIIDKGVAGDSFQWPDNAQRQVPEVDYISLYVKVDSVKA